MKWLACLALLLAGAVQAQGSVQRGEFEVHYSALPAATLAPDIARQYAVTRSPQRALLSIVVLQRGVAVSATVSGTATGANGERQTLAVREVREGASVSYLSEPRIAVRDTVAFDLSVQPGGDAPPIPVRFTQEFFP